MVPDGGAKGGLQVRFRNRVVTVGAGVALALTGAAGPALAHVEVSADKATAGAENVTLTFRGEAESDTAGIVSERVVLPEGIDPAGVTLVKAPAGWTFTRAADGFTVAGRALPVGTDSEWRVQVGKLPDGQTRLSFKTLETYEDGDVSRWIEIQEPGQDEPDSPAPLLTLKPGPSAAATPTAASPDPDVSSAGAPVLTPAASAPARQGGSAWWIWLVLGLLVLAALGFVAVRRRGTGPPG